jgi:peptidoglycan-associated lipoprotein
MTMLKMLKWSSQILVVVLAGAACHMRPPATSPSTSSATPPTVPSPPPLPPAPPEPFAAAVRPAADPITEAELFRRKSLDELNADHPLADAFFDYDQNSLRDDAREALQRDAVWLSKWPQTAISLEGYCDERGTAEYNLALGEQRARVVKEYLEGLGVSANRMRAVSLGKEAPFCHDANEDCWSRNRRGHFVITAK